MSMVSTSSTRRSNLPSITSFPNMVSTNSHEVYHELERSLSSDSFKLQTSDSLPELKRHKALSPKHYSNIKSNKNELLILAYEEFENIFNTSEKAHEEKIKEALEKMLQAAFSADDNPSALYKLATHKNYGSYFEFFHIETLLTAGMKSLLFKIYLEHGSEKHKIASCKDFREWIIQTIDYRYSSEILKDMNESDFRINVVHETIIERRIETKVDVGDYTFDSKYQLDPQSYYFYSSKKEDEVLEFMEFDGVDLNKLHNHAKQVYEGISRETTFILSPIQINKLLLSIYLMDAKIPLKEKFLLKNENKYCKFNVCKFIAFMKQNSTRDNITNAPSDLSFLENNYKGITVEKHTNGNSIVHIQSNFLYINKYNFMILLPRAPL